MPYAIKDEERSCVNSSKKIPSSTKNACQRRRKIAQKAFFSPKGMAGEHT
jgi:hypothetical protein